MVADDRRAQIAKRAYELWEAEGRPVGRDMIHWLRAEAEVSGMLPAPFKAHKPPALTSRPRKTKGPHATSPARRP